MYCNSVDLLYRHRNGLGNLPIHVATSRSKFVPQALPRSTICLAELGRSEASSIGNMFQFQLLELFAFRVEIDAAHFAFNLVEANIIETLKTGARYCADAVVWHQKMLFPSHEDSFSLGGIANDDGSLTGLLLKWTKGCKFRPVAQVNLAICAPVLVLSIEAVFRSDDFSLKICCKSGMILGQTLNPEIAAKERLSHVDMFDFNLHVVDLAFRLLCTVELATWTEVGRRS